MALPESDRGRLAARRLDVIAVLMALAFASVAVVSGLQTGYSRMDVDERVYHDTLLHMRAGESYYPAMRDALVRDKNERPTALRSLRPPTLFLLLRPLPPSSWRWVVGLVYLAIALLAWRLGRFFGALGGPVAVALAGIWLFGFTDVLFLHSEVWGLPFFMAGVVALRRQRDAEAAAWMTAATLFRELFALGLLLGFVLRRRRAWLVAVAVVGVALLVHALLARAALSPTGHDAGFGNEHRTLAFLLALVSPARERAAYAFGVMAAILGIAGGVRSRRSDPAAHLVVTYSVTLIVLSAYATRAYWSAAWAPLLASYVPGAIWVATRAP